jgi:hypothetical protein
MIEENESRSSHDLMATPTMGMGMVTRAAIQQQQRPIPDAYQGHQSRQATGGKAWSMRDERRVVMHHILQIGSMPILHS